METNIFYLSYKYYLAIFYIDVRYIFIAFLKLFVQFYGYKTVLGILRITTHDTHQIEMQIVQHQLLSFSHYINWPILTQTIF